MIYRFRAYGVNTLIKKSDKKRRVRAAWTGACKRDRMHNIATVLSDHMEQLIKTSEYNTTK